MSDEKSDNSQTPSEPAASQETPKPAETPVTKQPTENEKAAPAKATQKKDELVIRGFPKVVFFWPLAVVSLVFYFVDGGWWAQEATDTDDILGLWWLVLFSTNLLVFTFDFGRANFISLFTLIGVVLLGLTVWDQASEVNVWHGIYGFFADLNIKMNSNFYLSMFCVMSLLIGLSLVRSRFDYWVVGSNELIHKHGLLGDVRGYSTINMHVEKEIPDIFEWFLFGSGRLIFKPGGLKSTRQDVLIVENVFRVNRAERRVKKYLGVLKVDEAE